MCFPGGSFEVAYSIAALFKRITVLSQFEEPQEIHRAELLAGQIATSMRQRILAGDWKPGERIVESRLAKELGVGQPTIREALVALEGVGLVTRVASKGCIVTDLTPKQASDLLYIRRELESIAIGLIRQTASDSELARLTAMAQALKEVAVAGNVDDFLRSDLEFHQMAWRLSGNAFLPRLLEQVTLPLVAFFSVPGDLMLASAEAHLAMALELEQRNAEKAREANQVLLDELQGKLVKR